MLGYMALLMFYVLACLSFLDIVLMDSDRYRCICRSTTFIFEITEISMPYSFPANRIDFVFEEKM
jgi:hypothetical protein